MKPPQWYQKEFGGLGDFDLMYNTGSITMHVTGQVGSESREGSRETLFGLKGFDHQHSLSHYLENIQMQLSELRMPLGISMHCMIYLL